MEKIILDCDPGHDDAIAILLAAGNPSIDLLGITTVSGNHNVENTTRNALSTCTAYGIKVPVAKGSPGPMISDQVLAIEIHGETGLDGPVLPPASFDLDERHAVDFIIDTVLAHEPKTVTLVPVGPYTNIALAIRKEPRIIERVKRVVVMGGAYTRGNITPAAEFNVYGDPEAADVVFRADWDVTMVGLDLTHQALATPELQDRVRAVGGPISQFVLDIWEFIATTHGGLLQIAYPAVHDACCVAALIDPTIFTTEKGRHPCRDRRPVDEGHDGLQLREDGRHAPFRRHGQRAGRLPPHGGDDARPSQILRHGRGCAGAADCGESLAYQTIAANRSDVYRT